MGDPWEDSVVGDDSFPPSTALLVTGKSLDHPLTRRVPWKVAPTPFLMRALMMERDQTRRDGVIPDNSQGLGHRYGFSRAQQKRPRFPFGCPVPNGQARPRDS